MKGIKPLTAGLLFGAFFMLAPGLSHAQSPNYCYNHPADNSHYCYCYHHPKACNASYRSRYPDWNRPPDWNSRPDYYRHAHPEWYRQSEYDRYAGTQYARARNHAEFDRTHPGRAVAHPGHPYRDYDNRY